jgi:hypothetical protein
MGFGLVIIFIGLFKTTSYDCTLQITVTQRLVFSVSFFTALLGNIFQQLFLGFDTHRLAAILLHPPNLLTAIQDIIGNGMWFPLYSLVTVCTGNTAVNRSLVACVSVTAITWRLLSRCLAVSMFAEPLFLIRFYLQSVLVHSANCVKKRVYSGM